MRMVTRIARKELLEMRRDGRLLWARVIVAGLLLTALAVGWSGARRDTREREAAHRADRAEWLAQGARNPHSAAHFGRYAFKRVSPLAALDPGVNRYLGIAVWMEAHAQDAFRYRPAEDATALQRWGELTAAATLQILLPLLIVLVVYVQYPAEREDGTWSLLLSAGVRPRDILAGKALGVSTALATTLVPAVAIGVLATAVGADAGLVPSVARMLLLGLSYALYLAGFLAACLAIGARLRSSRAALVSLMAFWVVSTLVLPRLAVDLAERAAPSPTAGEFWHAIARDTAQGLDGKTPEAMRREALRTRTLAQYGVARLEDLPVAFDGIALQAGEEYGNRIFDAHFGRLWATFERQNRIIDASAVLSPVTAVRALSMGLAGTDLAQHRHFAEAAEAFRRRMIKQLNDEFRDKAGTAGYAYLDSGALWSKVADFAYEPPSIGWVIGRHRDSLAVLLGWCIVAVAAAVASAATMKR